MIHIKDEDAIGLDTLAKTIQDYKTIDDVFQMEFLQAVIFIVDTAFEKEILVSREAQHLLESWGNEWHEIHVSAGRERATPKKGVYLATRGQLFEAYKLYDDCQEAFLTSFVPGLRGYDSLSPPLTQVC